MATHKLKLKPFPVPNEVYMEMPVGLKQDGVHPLPKLSIEEIDMDALDELATEWLGALYASRKAKSPFRNTKEDRPMAMPYNHRDVS